ncbi:MAG: SAP domain-containing protein [Lachnospira sp.]|jgi:hypothetical protein
MKGHLDKKQLEDEYKVDELRELAKSLGLSPDGKKAELVERIAAAEVDVTDEDDKQQAAAANVSVSDTTIKVIVTETYKDLQRDITQHAGDTFEVTKERAAQLIEAGVAKAAE